MVEHHHKSCAGVLLQVWCPHHVARRLGCRVCSCQAGQETLLPGRAPHKIWWRPTRACGSLQLSNSPQHSQEGGISHSANLHVCRHFGLPGSQSSLHFGEKQLLGGFRLFSRPLSVKDGRKPPHPPFKWSCRRGRRPGRVRSP